MRGAQAVAGAMRRLVACFDDIAINMREAECYSDADRRLILDLIGDRSRDVDRMIKQQMVEKARSEIDAMARCRSLARLAPIVPRSPFLRASPYGEDVMAL